MNILVLLRGCPGSGKSTLISKYGLDGYTMSNDELRLLHSCPVVGVDGEQSISQIHDGFVNKLFSDTLVKRMAKGETIFIDACIQSKPKLSTIKKLAKRYRYRIYVYDLNVPLDIALKQNEERKGTYRYVSPDIVEGIYNSIQEEVLPSSFNVIEDFEDFIHNTLNFKKVDLTDRTFPHIKVIGDIHGCITPLQEATKDFVVGANLSKLPQLIFVGDFCDRGVNNQKVIQHLIYLKKNFPDNVRFIKGNHELHLELYVNTTDRDYKKVDFKSSEFRDNTIPNLECGMRDDEVALFKKDIRQYILGTMVFYSHIVFGDKDYLITHSGLPAVFDKSNMLKYRSNDLLKGIGGYNVNVGEVYKTNMKNLGIEEYPIQVHGHRNTPSNDVCICLENSIEYGGELLTYEIYRESQNNKVVKYENNDEIGTVIDELTGNKITLTKNVETNKMLLDKNIKVKSFGDVLSLNFDREVFVKKNWSERTIKARGLFVDAFTGEVVIRSYNKFFNLDEVDETKMCKLKRTIGFPVEVTKKYNGFLGLLSVRNREFIFASKSSIKSEHSKIFKDLFYKVVSKKDQKKLFDILSKNISCVFEVCDSVNDPHVYNYTEPKLYLLDFFGNDYDLFATSKNACVNRLINIAIRIAEKDFNTLKFKEVVATVYDWVELEKLIKEAQNAKGFEGYVFTDVNGFMFKVKGNEYKRYKKIFDNLHKKNPDLKQTEPLELLVPKLLGQNEN